eukprot:TRINITY_DN5263_c0_g1_i1.p1 TRINITY_DN5263_c0_g1~~TRINITY_DN5263_c0_g1_i1.p1  ORF type:complete len:531 (-),score=155.04 TRINITY_DN5263_c0_g1_i1:102-1694(-)
MAAGVETADDDARNRVVSAMECGSDTVSVLFRDLSSPARFPSELWSFEALGSLSVNTCSVRDLPEQVGALCGLTVLDLSNNAITSLPASLAGLTQLRRLLLASNDLAVVPPVVRALTQLDTLVLSANELVSFDDEACGALRSLTFLSLACNHLTELPASFGQLTSLQTLILSRNQLEHLPDCCGTLSALDTLEVTENRLTTVDACISEMRTLTTLNMRGNQITSFAHSDVIGGCLAALTALETLDLSENHLSILPIGALQALVKLELRCNQFTEIPEAVLGCPALSYLSLDVNSLKSVPSAVVGMSDLAVLSLNYNDIERVPDLKSMARLRSLQLIGNLVKEVDVAPLVPKMCRLGIRDPVPNEIIPGLYLGSMVAAKNKHRLKALGVTHIVTVLKSEENTSMYPNVFKYLVISADDLGTEDLLSHFEECHAFIDEALERDKTACLVHCGAGISRSATMVISYLMHKQNLTREQATKLVKSRRDVISPNPGFCHQLDVYHTRLHPPPAPRTASPSPTQQGLLGKLMKIIS